VGKNKSPRRHGEHRENKKASTCLSVPSVSPWLNLIVVVAAVFGFSATTTCISAQTTQPIRYRACDCHLHLVDFLQRTDGIRAALAAMDKCGVEEAIVSGMPLVKEWPDDQRIRPEYYLDDDARCYWYSATDVLVARQVLSLPADQQKRIHPTICGFNGADRNALDHIKRMIDWYPDLWQGIGEVMTRHDDLTALTYGEPAHADDLALTAVFTFAGEHDLPVFLHSNISSVWKHEPIYLPEVETAVRTHPKTRFIWCHAGISRRIVVPTLTTDLAGMLAKYPNLWIDVSWVVFESNLLKDGKPDPQWIKLVETYPDRFMIGTDKVGHFADYPQEIQKYYTFLDQLQPATASKLARENLLSVLPKAPAHLTDDESASLNGGQPAGMEMLKTSKN
jgi:Amidohydrolase